MPKVELGTASYWEESASIARFPQLDRDLTVDVAIVGAGITGLTAAYLLKQSGRRVAVMRDGMKGKVGVGKLQPLVRFQMATGQPSADPATPNPDWKMYEAYLTYVMDDYFLRVAAGYAHGDMGVDPKSNTVFLGVQMQR